MIRILLFALFSASALAGDEAPSLIGSWHSNTEATNAYFDKYAMLSDYQKKVFTKLFGRTVVTFRADGTGTVLMKAITIPKKDGGQVELEADKSDFTFKVLGSAKSQIVIKSDMGEKLFEGYPFAILKFHDQDTYSISLSDSLTEINGREFFKRVKTTDSAQGAASNPAKPGD
jgi:hypothetical protein